MLEATQSRLSLRERMNHAIFVVNGSKFDLTPTVIGCSRQCVRRVRIKLDAPKPVMPAIWATLLGALPQLPRACFDVALYFPCPNGAEQYSPGQGPGNGPATHNFPRFRAL
jgi:hypothetical protein